MKHAHAGSACYLLHFGTDIEIVDWHDVHNPYPCNFGHIFKKSDYSPTDEAEVTDFPYIYDGTLASPHTLNKRAYIAAACPGVK